MKKKLTLEQVADKIEVPGIDDCDILFSCSSRDGEESLYLRMQTFEFEQMECYACEMTWDGKNYCHRLPFSRAFKTQKQAVAELVEAARNAWGRGKFVKCTETRKLNP